VSSDKVFVAIAVAVSGLDDLERASAVARCGGVELADLEAEASYGLQTTGSGSDISKISNASRTPRFEIEMSAVSVFRGATGRSIQVKSGVRPVGKMSMSS
jgi:hypothetical protein